MASLYSMGQAEGACSEGIESEVQERSMALGFQGLPGQFRVLLDEDEVRGHDWTQHVWGISPC